MNGIAHTASTITILAPADAVWQTVGDFTAGCRYLTGVIGCAVEGQGIGALRTLVSADGSMVVERLEMFDPIRRRLSYLLLTDTPFGNCLTTMAVHELGPGLAGVEWSAEFEARGLPAGEAEQILEAAITANCSALKGFVEQSH